MNFGNYAVVDAYEHKFEKEPNWYWKIRAASSGDELTRAKFFVKNGTLVTNPQGKQYELPPLEIEVMHYEIALLFGGTNIPKDPEKPEDGEPILKEGASVAQVETVLRAMPHMMVREVWEALGQSTPFWGPLTGPKEEKPK